jgi:penicillin-binding protein 2
VLSPTGQVLRTFKPVAEGRLPVSKANLAFLQSALSQVPVVGTASTQFKTFPLAQIPIAAKTGTAEVAGKQPTSWFATYAPANKPRYAVVMMVSQGGFGSTTSAESVRAVYEALYGIRAKTINPKLAILPGGVPPVKLPVTTADGRILPPGSVLPTAPPATVTGASFTAGPSYPALPSAPDFPAPPVPPATPVLASGGPAWSADGRRARGAGT